MTRNGRWTGFQNRVTPRLVLCLGFATAAGCSSRVPYGGPLDDEPSDDAGSQPVETIEPTTPPPDAGPVDETSQPVDSGGPQGPAPTDSAVPEPPEPCAEGNFDDDGQCVPWSDCVAGEYVSQAGSDTTDRVCETCASATFSTGRNADACVEWTTCEAGEYVTATGGATSDRTCAPCAEGTFTSEDNATECQPITACAAGYVLDEAGDSTSNATCEACSAGEFCAGGESLAVACAAGTWDHDGSPATECTEWTTCEAGEYIAEEGTATTDRACSPCASGTFSMTVDSAECLPASVCAAGTVQITPATATTDVSCAPCAAGEFCAGGVAAIAACGAGTWDHDGSAATECVEWSSCDAGQFVSEEGSATTDRTCSGCASGSYSAVANAVACQSWTDCAPGSYVSTPGTFESDRTCSYCDSDSYTTSMNESSCLPLGSCPAGTVLTDPGNSTTAPTCEACTPGYYCAGGEASAIGCAQGTWDHDTSPATECVAETVCVPGERVESESDPVTDRVCVSCEVGSYTTVENETECTSWTSCTTGEFIFTAGTSTSDQVCSVCEPATYSPSGDADSCTAWSTCQPGEYESVAGTDASDRQCAACEAEHYSTTQNVTSCQAWSVCAAGTFVSNTPSATEDRDCQPCQSGTYSSGTNATECLEHGTCEAGTEQTAAGTSTAATSCEDCSAGEYCAGGEASAVACDADSYDDDSDPATACVAKTDCVAGEYVSSAGSATQNRTCAACESGSFSTEDNVSACQSWTTCVPGEYVTNDGTTTTDRTCAACEDEHFSATENADACEPWTVCDEDTIEAAPGTASSDRACGSMYRASVASDGSEGNSHSYWSAVSGTGRYIAFGSQSSNLVSGDTNGTYDTFVHDKETKTTTRVSVASDGTQANDSSDEVSISDDGRYVAFYSYATNLVSNDTNGQGDIFVHDRQTGATTRVNVANDGTQANSHSYQARISGNGRFVTFYSYATNLVSGDTNSNYDIFVHDRQTATTSRVSVATGGAQSNNQSFDPSISTDGRYVAFRSYATNLVSGDTNNAYDVFLHDRETTTTTRVSVASDGTQGNNASNYGSVSGNGQYVVFTSSATNLVSGDTNGGEDVFVRDVINGTTTRVNVASDGTQADTSSNYYYYYNNTKPTISSDGTYVAFGSYTSNLVPGDTNGYEDVFIHNRLNATTVRVNVSAEGLQANGDGYWAQISSDGRFVSFSSYASNLVPGDTNNSWDVFVTLVPQ